MSFLRRLFGLDFPDPAAGQVWRSRHSGRAIRVTSVLKSDCGSMWHIALQHEDGRGFIPIGTDYHMFPYQWRRMLREEARTLEPAACADTGAPKDPRGCWNVRCQLGGTCCRAHGVMARDGNTKHAAHADGAGREHEG